MRGPTRTPRSFPFLTVCRSVEANVVLKHNPEFSFKSQKVVVFKLSRSTTSPRQPPHLWPERNVGSAVTAGHSPTARQRGFEALTHQLMCNLDVLPTVPKSPWVILHAFAALSTATVSRHHTHIRRRDTLKHTQMHTMMHYYNEKWHVQGPEAPLNQCVGGNSTDLLKTFDVLMVFGCYSIFHEAEWERPWKNPDFTGKVAKWCADFCQIEDPVA